MGYYRLFSLLSGNKYNYEETAEATDGIVADYINYFSRMHTDEEVARFLGIEGGKPHILLEIGSGICWFQMLAAKKFPRCFFISSDIDLKKLKLAKGKIHGKNVCFAAAMGEGLPLKPNSVDSVLVFNTFEHLASAEKTLAEVSAVLRQGGRCYLNAPNKFGLGHLDSRILGRVREFSCFELARMARNAGLSCHFIPPEKPRTNNGLKKIIFEIMLCTSLWKVFKPHGFRVLLTK